MADNQRETVTRTRSRKASNQYEALQQMSDEDLMSQFQAGTVEAFNILVDRYSDRLMQYLYRFLGDMKRCEDLLQETFLRVHRNRHSYRRIAKFSTWLYTIDCIRRRLRLRYSERARLPAMV